MAIDTIKSTAVLDGAIATADIADDAVTADKLANAINTSIAAKLPLAGGTITGDIAFGDSVKAKFGTGNDLEIYHDPSGPASYISDVGGGDLILKGSNQIRLQQANGDSLATFNEDGSAQLYHNNAEKLTTTVTGIDVTGAVNSTGEMRITNPSATSQLYLYGAAGQKANIILNEYGVRAWEIGSGTVATGTFSISGAGNEKLRILSNGRVHLGSASTNLAGHLNCVGEYGSGYRAIAFSRTNGGAEVGSILTSASSTTYATSSDYRLKENVDYTWDATTRLKQLKPARFNFIADPDITVDGFLAHEAQSVVPESVVGIHNEVDDDDNAVYQGIDQSKLVPLLVKTIQELEARITALEDA